MLMASSVTQNVTMAVLPCRTKKQSHPDRRATSDDWGLAPASARANASGARSQQPIDVEGAECENESVNHDEDDKRDRRATRSQERCHRIRGPQQPIDDPRLASDLRR